MKTCGILGLILAVLSFVFWLVSWGYWTFLFRSFGPESPFEFVARICHAVSVVCMTLAVIMISIGLMQGPRREGRGPRTYD